MDQEFRNGPDKTGSALRAIDNTTKELSRAGQLRERLVEQGGSQDAIKGLNSHILALLNSLSLDVSDAKESLHERQYSAHP